MANGRLLPAYGDIVETQNAGVLLPGYGDFVETSGGAATHTTTGDLIGQGATIAGTANNFTAHSTSGVLAGQGATVAGTADHTSAASHGTTGALTGAGAVIAGTAAHIGIHATSGVLVGPGARILGYATGAPLVVIDTHDGFAHDEKWRKPVVEREALRAQIIHAVRGPESEAVQEIIAPHITPRMIRRGKAIALEKRIDFASLYQDLEAVERFQALMEQSNEDEFLVSMLLQ